MRTPVILVAGQGDTDAVTDVFLQTPGTLVIKHRFDGQVAVCYQLRRRGFVGEQPGGQGPYALRTVKYITVLRGLYR